MDACTQYIGLPGVHGELYLLSDPVAAALVEGLLQPNLAVRSDRLLNLTQQSPIWAAWITDRVTRGGRQVWSRWSAGEQRMSEPVGWEAVVDPTRRLLQGALAKNLADAVLVTCDSEQISAWHAHQQQLAARIQRLRVAANGWTAPPSAVGLWAAYLLADVAIEDAGGAVGWQIPELKLTNGHLASESDDDWTRLTQVITEWPRTPITQEPIGRIATDGQKPAVVTVASALLASIQRYQRAEEHEWQFEQALERAKIDAMKELAYGASHEINNPLANISSRAQMLLRNESDPQRRRALATINSQAFRAHEMIADMMLFAKPPELQRVTLSLSEFLAELFEPLVAACPESVELSMGIAVDPSMRVEIDPDQITVAVRAIWQNAMESMGDVGMLEVRAEVVEGGADEGIARWAELCVRDSGPGISADVRQHLFDPFYSGREAGRGLGFGLSKAWRIIELHAGQIVVSSQPGEPTSLTMRLPVSAGPLPQGSRGDTGQAEGL